MKQDIDWFRVFLIGVAGALLLWMLAFSHCASAADAKLSWVNPTTNVDGSTIPSTGTTRLLLTRIEYGTCAGTAPSYTFGTKQGEATFNAPATTGTTTGHSPGTTVCFRAYARNAENTESAPSNVAAKVFAPAQPAPPSLLSVADTTVYTVVKSTDRFVMLPVGTAPAGTACDTSQSVNGKYVIPRDTVTWSGNVKPLVVVADCG